MHIDRIAKMNEENAEMLKRIREITKKMTYIFDRMAKMDVENVEMLKAIR